jgi:lipoate-protein ligase A
MSAAENMALDTIILEEVAALRSPPTLRFLQFSPSAALVGYHQDADLEIRTDFCKSQGIDINRRLTGGGSIFFQESALGWELFGPSGEPPFRGSFEHILQEVCNIAADAISLLGVPARFRPRNDIEVDGRKMSGTGGVFLSGGYMFQGTLLIKNEIDLFLRALRVPVEKLKKREIESLMDRVCFLNDLVTPAPSIHSIKATLAHEFAAQLAADLEPRTLTRRERFRLSQEVDYFRSSNWVSSRSRPEKEGIPCRSIFQTEAGTLRVHLWLSPGGKTVRQALIVGDFFTAPNRLIHDLEAALVGSKAQRDPLLEKVESFLSDYPGEMLGIRVQEVAHAVASAAERLGLVGDIFSQSEANELFFVNTTPLALKGSRPRWLLLPYCSKNLNCEFRTVPGCNQCGECEIGDSITLARSSGLEPITIQSFEHLMEVLQTVCRKTNGFFVGSCCEAFFAKHQREMEAIGTPGVLVNLDSTTCYDLGKGSAAYKGHFDNKTSLNTELIRKTLRFLNDSSTT